MKLYHFPPSPNSRRVLAVAYHLGFDPELEIVDIPKGKQINRSELQKFHKSKIKHIAREEPSWFGVYPVNEWTCK